MAQAKVKITQIRSQIGQSERHRGTLRARRSIRTPRSSPVCCEKSATS